MTKGVRRRCAGTWRLGDMVGGGSLVIIDGAKVQKFCD